MHKLSQHNLRLQNRKIYSETGGRLEILYQEIFYREILYYAHKLQKYKTKSLSLNFHVSYYDESLDRRTLKTYSIFLSILQVQKG